MGPQPTPRILCSWPSLLLSLHSGSPGLAFPSPFSSPRVFGRKAWLSRPSLPREVGMELPQSANRPQGEGTELVTIRSGAIWEVSCRSQSAHPSAPAPALLHLPSQVRNPEFPANTTSSSCASVQMRAMDVNQPSTQGLLGLPAVARALPGRTPQAVDGAGAVQCGSVVGHGCHPQRVLSARA